ncbi:hypothetical protein [Lysinibacillus xylanilyticus]|uniref:Uncharacterized protein n=1 Tax=Lysinibacillus xylanilyticus TaxID=582475 RepID=A0ABT4EWN1_9BACI|nr:hypothetical protein [Lysinibacillus xylanilyticus]MCY9549438.1 hypothetical protein [Lysinibacillus xylanilyticus]
MANDMAGNTTPNEMNQIGPSTVKKLVDSFLEDELPTRLEGRKVMSNKESIYTKCNKSCGHRFYIKHFKVDKIFYYCTVKPFSDSFLGIKF